MRCVGSALSPNGLAFSKEGMLSLALMDQILNVDTSKDQVTVQAGARVQEVVEAIRPYGLTLENYASIREQSIGGFTQVCPIPQLQLIPSPNPILWHPFWPDYDGNSPYPLKIGQCVSHHKRTLE